MRSHFLRRDVSILNSRGIIIYQITASQVTDIKYIKNNLQEPAEALGSGVRGPVLVCDRLSLSRLLATAGVAAAGGDSRVAIFSPSHLVPPKKQSAGNKLAGNHSIKNFSRWSVCYFTITTTASWRRRWWRRSLVVVGAVEGQPASPRLQGLPLACHDGLPLLGLRSPPSPPWVGTSMIGTRRPLVAKKVWNSQKIWNFQKIWNSPV